MTPAAAAYERLREQFGEPDYYAGSADKWGATWQLKPNITVTAAAVHYVASMTVREDGCDLSSWRGRIDG
jgi:predicted 3-demethylubiquinone-9 3-methyltransferase (glyoxalase superfamily)